MLLLALDTVDDNRIVNHWLDRHIGVTKGGKFQGLRPNAVGSNAEC